MSENHTKGRLVLGPHGAIRGGPVIRFMNGSAQEQVAMTTGAVWMGPGEHVANARRLVACWNACDGIPTDALEKGRLSRDAFEAEESRADKAEAERDALLDVLKRCREMVNHPDAVAVVDAAIAKAEGGAA